MTTLTVETDSRPGRKSRRFSAVLLGHVTAPGLWANGNGGDRARRPVWATIAAPQAAIAPFLANLRLGKLASAGGNTSYEWLRSVRYTHTVQRTEAGVLATIYLPELFRADPGMIDPAGGIRFVALPTAAWIAAQAKLLDVDAAVRHVQALVEPEEMEIRPEGWGKQPGAKEREKQRADLVSLAPLASLFTLYLDRRTRCPIVPDLRFQLQLLVTCLRAKVASLASEDRYQLRTWSIKPGMLTAEIDDALGYGPAVACDAAHETMERILAEETERYFRVAKVTATRGLDRKAARAANG